MATQAILSEVVQDAYLEEALFPNVLPGPTGPTGPRGPPGNTMYPRAGPPTISDTYGFNNLDLWLDMNNGDMFQFIQNGNITLWSFVGNVKGPTGPTGPTGPELTGPTGPHGCRGPSGPSGCQGPPGNDGRVASVFTFLGKNPTMAGETGDLAIGNEEREDGTTLLSFYSYTTTGWSLAGTVQGFNKRHNICEPVLCPVYPSNQCLPNQCQQYPYQPICPPYPNRHPNGCRCNECCRYSEYNCTPRHPFGCRCHECSRSNCRTNLTYIHPTFNLTRNIGIGMGSSTTLNMSLNVNSEGPAVITLSSSGTTALNNGNDDNEEDIGILFELHISYNCDQNVNRICGSVENLRNGRWNFNMTRHTYFDRCGNYQLTLTIRTLDKTSIVIDPISSSHDFLTITTALS